MSSIFDRAPDVVRPPSSRMRLRPYQETAVQRIEEARARGARSGLVVMPTGCGKTVTFVAATARDVQERRALYLVHRSEIVHQIAATVKRATGYPGHIEMADEHVRLDPAVRAVCASKDSLRNRLHRHDPCEYSAIVTDEAHRAVAKTYRDIYAHFHRNPSLFHLGVTATPDRLDEKALGQVFDEPLFDLSLANAIRDGWLCPIHQDFIRTEELDFSAVRKRAGDFAADDLERLLKREEAVHAMVAPLVEIAGDRRTLVFAGGVEHARMVAEVANRYAGREVAAAVDGKTDPEERRRLFRQFGAGQIQFLVNVGIATEGWDDPATDGRGVQIVAVMRPTQSRALYAQMIGRGTRTLPGTVDDPALKTREDRRQAIAASAKPHVLVIDFTDQNSSCHELVHAADILGGDYSEDAVARASRRDAKGAERGPTDVLWELDKLEDQVRRELEVERRKAIVANRAHWTSESRDPFQQLSIPRRRVPGWHANRKPSDRMVAALKREGIHSVDRLNFGEAHQLLDALFARPSEKQAKLLLSKGYQADFVFDLDRSQSKALVSAIQANGWQALSDADARAVVAQAKGER